MAITDRSKPALLPRALRFATLSGLALSACSSVVLAQVRLDPDPEIFDGTNTKTDMKIPEAKVTIDDWEGPNLIIYDSDEGSPQGGAGRAGLEGPGMDIGVPGGGGMGLPIPMGGAGGMPGMPSMPSMQIPTGAESTPGAGGKEADTKGAAQSAARPSDVSIGDPSKRIATTAQGQAGNTPGEAEGGEPGAKEAGEDSTEIEKAANTSQTGKRGGGVEKGDAMPPDM